MTLLVVDDDTTFNELISQFLTREGFRVISSYRSAHALQVLSNEKPDLVLIDYKLPEMDGLELTRRIKKIHPGLPVVLISNYADLRVAVNSIKLGAFEFITKPVNPDELLKVIQLALSKPKAELVHQNTLPSGEPETNYVIGKNPQTTLLWNHVTVVAPTRMNVIIHGESGTGKEHIARTLHGLSHRKSKPFVAVDCGALSAELAASELFGHLKGSFTGAGSDKIGLFEEAHEGTLFLDEVGNLPYDIQVLLLRAIQEGSIKKVGSSKEIKVDVRIIAATNDELRIRTEDGSFRNDLYHRLNEFELRVPPLRERLDDLDEFCDFFIAQAAKELNKAAIPVSGVVRDYFMSYRWPGNLRELRNIIRRALLLSVGAEITIDALPSGMTESTEQTTPSVGQPFQKDHGAQSLKDLQKSQERQAIIDALVKYKYNKSKVAAALSIDRSTLYNKIRQYNIEA